MTYRQYCPWHRRHCCLSSLIFTVWRAFLQLHLIHLAIAFRVVIKKWFHFVEQWETLIFKSFLLLCISCCCFLQRYYIISSSVGILYTVNWISIFVIYRIIKVKVWVISPSQRLRPIILTKSLIILDITKNESNNCLVQLEISSIIDCGQTKVNS